MITTESEKLYNQKKLRGLTSQSATDVDTSKNVQKNQKKKVTKTINQLSEDAVMKEGQCDAAGDWSRRVWTVTNALTTGSMKRGTAPENGVLDLTQEIPEKLNTVQWEKYVLRHSQKKN